MISSNNLMLLFNALHSLNKMTAPRLETARVVVQECFWGDYHLSAQNILDRLEKNEPGFARGCRSLHSEQNETRVFKYGEAHIGYGALMKLDDYAENKDTGIIDLLLVGNIDPYHLNDLSRKTERYIKRKIRPLVLSSDEFEQFRPKLEDRPRFLVWEAT